MPKELKRGFAGPYSSRMRTLLVQADPCNPALGLASFVYETNGETFFASCAFGGDAFPRAPREAYNPAPEACSMRMGRACMLRLMIVPLGLALMAGPGLAQPRIGGAGFAPPPSAGRAFHAPPIRHAPPVVRPFPGISAHPRGALLEAGRHRLAGRGRWGSVAGYPPLYPFWPDPEVRYLPAPVSPQAEPDEADPFTPVVVGIARSPTPTPTLYRIEGRRDRPVTRVIRIGAAEPRGLRDRYAHAETGALLLTVPGR